MQADRVEISRDTHKNQWLIRIQVGEEVIRRHSKEANDADEATLKAAAIQTTADEGYTVAPANVAIV
jgi:hypothetical protein